jgi:UTP--glucose-1-phosphate uridylyltransferase
MNCKTAVIPVGGWGTRRLPATAGSEKCLLPVSAGNTDLIPIDMMLDECGADTSRVVLVTSKRGEQRLRDYFDPDRIDQDFVDYCIRQNRLKDLEVERARRASYRERFGEFIYVTQRPEHGYGTAVPFYLTTKALQEEIAKGTLDKIAVVGGDDFIYHEDGTSELSLAKKAWKESGADHMIMGVTVPRNKASAYGVLIPHPSNSKRLAGFVEKPSQEELDEILKEGLDPLGNISRYCFTLKKILPCLNDELDRKRTAENPEYYITDVIINAVNAGQTFYIHRIAGDWYDTGTPQASRVTSNELTKRVIFTKSGHGKRARQYA